MDNLTHSLIGAVLGQAGLKRRTGLAMPALIIAANLPDIDAAFAFHPEGLAIRRGITHGPIALALLPLVLWAVLVWFDRWQARRGKRPADRAPVDSKWLLALCYLGAITHPALDWLNNYGIRLLSPFSERWFYGDVLFIVDPWLWAIVGGGLWLSLRREKRLAALPYRPARVALVLALGFIGLNLAISRHIAFMAASDAPYAPTNVANAVPLEFWRRDVLWRARDGTYGSMPCSLSACERYPLVVLRSYHDYPGLMDVASLDSAARAFLFWSRMPVAEVHRDRIVLRDQRFMDPRIGDRFKVVVRPPQ